MQKIAVICANGIGDALMSLVLSHHAMLAGLSVDTYSTNLLELKEWFPGKSIYPFPKEENIQKIFNLYDTIFAADHSFFLHSWPDCPKCILFKENSFDKTQTIVENLLTFSKKFFKLKEVSKTNGILPPSSLQFQRFSKRVILHTEATEFKRKWPAENFIRLGSKLANKGWEPAICLSTSERKNWQSIIKENPHILFPETQTLADVAAYIYESRALIGNNSGLGHLASCLGVPTISLFARKSYAKLWRPGFGKNHVATPYPFLIGSKLKHKYWKKFLTPSKAFKIFLKAIIVD